MIMILSFLSAISTSSLEDESILVKKQVDGNYLLKCVIDTVPDDLLLFFSSDNNRSQYCYLNLTSSYLELGQYRNGKSTVWRKYNPPVWNFPLEIRLLKKGNFFRFWARAKRKKSLKFPFSFQSLTPNEKSP